MKPTAWEKFKASAAAASWLAVVIGAILNAAIFMAGNALEPRHRILGWIVKWLVGGIGVVSILIVVILKLSTPKE